MTRSTLLPLHEAAGHRLAGRPEAPDSAVPVTYGDVPSEYRAAREACGLLDETDRGRLTVTGTDAAEFLHRLLACDVNGLAAGSGTPGLLLTPKGKVLSVFALWRTDAARFELDCAPGAAPGLAAKLDAFLFGEDVQLLDESDACAPLDLVGEGAAEVLAAVLGPLPATSPGARIDVDHGGRDVHVGRTLVAGADGWRVDAGAEGAAELWKALVAAGATPVGLAARDALRVEALAALEGVDVDDGVYPQEAGLDAGFSLSKGCYVGQEVVAKINTYGGVNKRLCALRVSDDTPLARGARLLRAEGDERRDVGMVTSWAWSFELDGPLALGYVKRGHQDPGTRLAVDGTEQTVEVLAGPVRERPTS
jgi:folate-binding protein YgfZ